MARLQTFLARLCCVVMIGAFFCVGFLGKVVDWPTRLVSVAFILFFGTLLLYFLDYLPGDKIQELFPFLRRFNGKLLTITVNDKRAVVCNVDGVIIYSVANMIYWKPDTQKIFAIGGPNDWPSTAPRDLPEGVIGVDLVAEASPATPHINELWPAFVLYCREVGRQKAALGLWQSISCRWIINVRLDDHFKSDFVCESLTKERLLRGTMITKEKIRD
jgi:hypothetical protein